MQGFFPEPLLRSLQRFAQLEDVKYSNESSYPSVLATGLVVGTCRDIKTSGLDTPVTQQVAVWGLLQSSSDDTGDYSFTQYLPGGISCIGNFVIVHGEDLTQLDSAALQITNDDKTKVIVLAYNVTTKSLQLFHCKDGKATMIEMQNVQCLHTRDFYRIIGLAPLISIVDFHVHGDESMFLRRVEKFLAATNENGDFYVRVGYTEGKKERGFRILDKHGNDIKTQNELVYLNSIVLQNDNNDELKNDKKHKKGKKKMPIKQKESNSQLGFFPTLEYGNITNIELLIGLAPSDTKAVAPVITIPSSSTSNSTLRRYHVHCEAFVVVPVESSVKNALALLRNQLHNQLTDVANRLKHTSEDNVSITTHQFPLIGAAFPLTLSSDESMTNVAKLEKLHRVFMQPFHQPLFRLSRGCSLTQQGEWLLKSNVLVNVHEGISNSGLGEQCLSAIVQGFYGYYHYLQQGINDKGWGCAYRSLQTLASWLFLQHYTQHEFLSHEQIQRVLVKIGDKPARFQGSTEWIGSLEVGYVLDELFGVTFRSLNVSSGSQLPEVARELLHHFQTQGTPVMMGGGQLAFTLLGVEYHPDTGVCAFLTLDPHYTGEEDLATIQNDTVALEGYKAVPCSWRKTTSFAKSGFYNFCLPQRPSGGV
ncbi:Uncharacterized conserved protein [Plasmopara halstedii]|uniref:Uncharacterized conserved protein n=1 Tax=Plasmopara halstedii TaxID=4781 RepID=A0A0N7L8P2_PLAHL|nr:Uncharacterized conserved protein [Plasmopara halstedii]CEG50427.1 Uncharacterized conserved protein [Plasmopara halstedii]|eukprot:XP_024586796.1 Uncharacterized conserved protein [Plasmopara halstedii]